MTQIVFLVLVFGVVCAVMILRSAMRRSRFLRDRPPCPRCGVVSPVHARFCPQCGSPLS